MINDKIHLRLLVVEDDPDWRSLIQKGITIASNSGADISFVEAEETSSAKFSLSRHLFHGLSVDQNMPVEIGGQTGQTNGVQLIKSLVDRRLPAFMSVYTAYPDYEISNTVGALGEIPYKIKAAKSSGEEDGRKRMDALDYGAYFTTGTINSFVPRTLANLARSGFHNLADQAADAKGRYDAFAETGFSRDEEAGRFFAAFSKFREHFNNSFAALTCGFAQSKNVRLDTLSRKANASLVESWLRKSWTALEQSGDFSVELASLRTYLMLDEGVNFGVRFADASEALREIRNKTAHEDWRFSPEDFFHLRGAFMNYADVVGTLARLPLISQPRFVRSNYLSFTELNRSRPSSAEIFYADGELPNQAPEKVFTMLPGMGELISLDGGITTIRDQDTNRRCLKEVGLR